MSQNTEDNVTKKCPVRNPYIEDIQVFGVNMTFISLSEVKIFYIS